MAKTSDLSLALRLFLKTYRYRSNDPVPFVPLSKPLAECKVGLVSSAGFVPPGVEPFDEGVRGGDSTWRAVPADTDPTTLADCHRSESFDHSAMEKDPDLAFPLTRITELVEQGFLGSSTANHVSIMGSITATGNLIQNTAPEVAAYFQEQGADLVLLVPV